MKNLRSPLIVTLMSTYLALFAASSFAQNPNRRPLPPPGPTSDPRGGGGSYERQEAIQKSRELSHQIARNAPYMRRYELRQFNLLLDQAMILVQGGAGGGSGYPPPPPPPPPSASACKLLGRGSHAGWSYNYRVAINGQTLEGTDDLNVALAKLDQLQRDRMCILESSNDSCQLQARGSYAGWTYNFRAALNGEAISGSDRSEDALAALAKLERAGVCRIQAAGSCQLLGSGSYAGWTYQYRLGIGSEVYSGSDRYEHIQSLMNSLRAARVCY